MFQQQIGIICRPFGVILGDSGPAQPCRRFYCKAAAYFQLFFIRFFFSSLWSKGISDSFDRTAGQACYQKFLKTDKNDKAGKCGN